MHLCMVGLVLTDVSLAYAQMDLWSQSSFVMFDDYYTCGFIMRPHQSITNSSTLSLLVVGWLILEALSGTVDHAMFAIMAHM